VDSQEWDARYAAVDLVWSAEPNRFLAAEAADLTPGRALDLGCGEGRNAIWLAERGWDVTGVDFSRVAIDKARRLADARGVTVTWAVADIVTATLQPHMFDLVVLLYLQLPARERATVLGHAARAVAPGGTLLVVAHDSTNLTDGWGGPQDPDVLYGPEDVVPEIAGLEIVRAERVAREVATDDGPKHAIDVLVRATRPAPDR
jgi:SAM-dependent methyltransferase